MTTMSVDDLQAELPTIKEKLAVEREILITQDGAAFAKLSSVAASGDTRKRFDPIANQKWKEETFGKGVVFTDVDEMLARDRADRAL